ncbi:hypothetical protein LCGC14_1533040 [marine sediment metagenome]|uniref:Uncharacterized protein n=1 Tax=marine sediment metagenome TaxID=412755 RepID=A0A0F9LW73_9ZZZZ
MAYVAVIVTVAEMQFKAGENRDATGDVEANHIVLQNEAMGYLSGFIQDDVSAGFSGYDAVTKLMLTEWAARYGGLGLMMFNPAGYTELIEAEDMAQVHIYRMEKIEEELSKGEVQKQIKVNK